MNRFWDPEGAYSAGTLKEYRYWVLEVNYRQPTFGNFIVFCKREGVQALSELNDEELIEFKLVLNEIESALKQNPNFQPIRFNYWQMGNVVHQLHVHGIPRYEETKEFLGRKWIDADTKKPPVWAYENQSNETVAAFKQEMLKFLV
jgi:diadenosine tetraphosphate (Ap4A) HIT family hydrolase